MHNGQKTNDTQSEPRQNRNAGNGQSQRSSSAAASSGDPAAHIHAAGAPPVTIAGAPPAAVVNRTLPETFTDERDDVLSVITELEDQLDRYEQIREKLERELSEASEQARTARTRVQELEWQIVTLNTKLEQTEATTQEITLLEEELADANTRAQRMNEQITTLDKENARLATELKTAQKQLEELWTTRQERDGLRADVKALKGKVDQFERGIREFVEERTVLQARLNDATKALEDTRAIKNRVELELRTSGDRIDEYQRIIEALEQKIELGKREKKTLLAQVTHMERENTRLQEQTQFYECELASLRTVNRNAESTLTHVKQAFSEVRVALSETKARARRRTIEGWPRTTPGLRLAGESAAEVVAETSAGTD